MKILINDKYIDFNFSNNFENIYKERVGVFNKEEKEENTEFNISIPRHRIASVCLPSPSFCSPAPM